ncbi:cell wall hydrolase [Sphingomonas flavalba]|uniref:cell wall hydrolase n=1 Tax=Sphingomonas flavalba TaxID=2559804 RepID=UPI0039E135BD
MTFCAGATLLATDPTFAGSGTMAAIVTAPAPVLTIESQGLLDDAAITFAPRQEVVQTIAPRPAVTTEPADPASLAALVSAHTMPDTLDPELRCLAGAVYFEAKSEPLEGQLAVAEVVINRAESGRFPRGICQVIFQRSQFSFVRNGALPPIRTSSRSWKEAVAVAEIAMNDQWQSRAADALFFHATHVSPNWGKDRVVRLGNHIFYR